MRKKVSNFYLEETEKKDWTEEDLIEFSYDDNSKTKERNIEKYITSYIIRDCITKEQNEALIIEAQNGNALAEEYLLKFHSRLVVKCAKKYRKFGVTFEDLYQEGMLGLYKAIHEYDAQRNVEFSTYAVPWILSKIRRYIAYNVSPVRFPAHFHESMKKYQIMQTKIEEGTLDLKTDEEKIEYLGVTKNVFKNIEKFIYVSSLDRTVPSVDGEMKVMDIIAAPDNNSPELMAEQNDLANVCYDLLNSLPEQQKYVLEHRMGFVTGEVMTLDEIGREMNLTRERVRQIEKTAIERLRRKLMRREFSDYVTV